MDITRFAINNTRTTAIALLVVILGGIRAYQDLPRAEDPGFTMRHAQVVTVFPGASPARMEMLVTEPLERAIKQMPELDSVTSTSKTGVSIVMVSIKDSYTNMRPIWDSLRRKVDAIQGELPEGCHTSDVNDEFGDVFGIVIAITAEGYSPAELEEVGKDLRDEMLRLPEAGKSELFGVQQEQVFVEYNNANLAASGLTPFALKQILESRNIVLPGGSISTGRERITLEPTGNFESVEDIRNTVITLPGRGVMYLRDLAKVTRGYVDPPTRLIFAGGLPALALGVSLRGGGNITVLGTQVTDKLRELEGLYPIGVEFDFVSYQPKQVNRKVDDFILSLLQAIGIVMAVMLLTLGLRTGLLVAALIPTTMLASLLLMQVFDIGIDQISLAALIIALGMLVDNAIVMSESIMVAMAGGKSVREASVSAAKELRIPLLVASLTTSASFLPVFLAKSMVGEYTSSIFKVVTIALLSSWVLALTMTPLLCVLFLRIKAAPEASDRFDSKFYRAYRGTLLLCLRNRLATLAVTIAIFFGVISLFSKVPFMFFPASDQPLVRAELRMPIGTPIEQSERIATELSAYLDEIRGSGDERKIDNWASFVGAGAPRYSRAYSPEPPSPDYGYFIINLTSFDYAPEIIDKVEYFLLTRYPDLTPTVDSIKYGPPVKNPIAVRISGKELGTLFDIVEKTKAKLNEIPGSKNIKDDWGPQNKKIVVDINQPRARRAGTSNQDIALSLQTVLSGIQSTQYREGDKSIPVTLRSVSADRQDLGKIESLNVFSPSRGTNVPLKQVADLKVQWQPAKILRRDQLKTVTVSSELQSGVTARQFNQVLVPWLEAQKLDWAIGYDFVVGGEHEESGKANRSIVDQLPIAGMIILLLLVGQFNSIRKAAIVSLTIPLGLIGVTLGLLMTGSYFGFMTFLGIISLSGIVINNAIVLLDRINLEIKEGHSPADAILRSAQLRLRPILLTTATTVGGLLPLWFGGGAMFEPMAIAIIFGMLFSTLLTLGVVPVLYALFFGVRFGAVIADAA